jgi:hypothetical protein
MKDQKAWILIAGLTLTTTASAQKKDTILINASKVNTKVLKPGTHRYLVYFKNGKDSSRKNYQMWNRIIDFVNYQGKDAISITQEWEDNDTVIHKAYSVCDRKSFEPLFQESWWRKRGTTKFDFINRQAFFLDTALTASDTTRLKKNMYSAFQQALEQHVFNWHLDLEVFPLLPYKNGTTFLINFYDPGFPAPKLQAYTVDGSEV